MGFWLTCSSLLSLGHIGLWHTIRLFIGFGVSVLHFTVLLHLHGHMSLIVNCVKQFTDISVRGFFPFFFFFLRVTRFWVSVLHFEGYIGFGFLFFTLKGIWVLGFCSSL